MKAGARVHDREDDRPNDAVVVHRPEDTTIADWEYDAGGETYTTAESNPDYDADEQLVLVAFMHELFEHWPDWVDAEDEAIYEGATEHDVPLYGFPESRMREFDPATKDEDGVTYVDEMDDEDEEGVADPEAFAEIRARLEENDFEVTEREDGGLVVEKYGTEYVVEPDGSVEGEAGLRNRVTSIVDRYL